MLSNPSFQYSYPRIALNPYYRIATNANYRVTVYIYTSWITLAPMMTTALAMPG